jgi:hypothetical protein
MDDPTRIDRVLIQWGDRLFYPANRIVRTRPQPRLSGPQARQRAAEIRARIKAIAVRRAPQVMVKVTGGGRGMKAICAHMRYISKNGRLDIEDENGTQVRGRDAVRELAADWRFGGSPIDDISDRREAFNIILSMPRGSAQPLVALNAAREFAKTELAGHKYVIVLHDPSQPARSHQRARRVQGGPTPQPTQDRPAPLARDLRRNAMRLGHRCRCDATDGVRCDAQLPGAVASEGAARRPPHPAATCPSTRPRCPDPAQRRPGSMGPHRARTLRIR